MKSSHSFIVENIDKIKAQLPAGIKLVAVSKFHPVSCIVEAYRGGHRCFGESRVQELVSKYEELKDYSDIEWHFIGPLQTNKVKFIVPFVSMIESVTSLRLLQEIQKQASKQDKVIDILLEVHLAKEETKSGFDIQELRDTVALIVDSAGAYAHIRLRGLMTIATQTDDEAVVKSEFATLKSLFDEMKEKYHEKNEMSYFDTVSMGMSHDYNLAIQEGANVIRVGSLIFGERQY